MAITCAEKSLRVEEQFKQGADPVRTRINYGLLLGLAQRREEAVEQIETAIAMIEDAVRGAWLHREGRGKLCRTRPRLYQRRCAHVNSRYSLDNS